MEIDKSKSLFFPFNVPSSKNAREIGFYFLKPEDTSNWYIKKGNEFKKIRPTLQSSDLTKQYVKNILPTLLELRPAFRKLTKDLPKPYIIQAHFVRDSKRKFDYHNAYQCLADCLTGHYWENDKKIPRAAVSWLEDDDCDNLIIIPPLKPPFYTVDKNAPGVWLTVLDIYKYPTKQTELMLPPAFPKEAADKYVNSVSENAWQDIHSQIMNQPEITRNEFLGTICVEKGCGRPGVRDYNGHGHVVCQQCYERLSNYFDEEYR